MLFDSTLRRELARNFGGTLVVILTIVLTIMFIRTLGQAALGRISPQDVVLLLVYIGLGHLPTMLALSLFIAIVATLSRMYHSSEMTIWFASGVSLTRFVRPVLRTSWPVLLVIALLALFAWPWQNRRSAELRDEYDRRSDLSRIAPGQFQTSADGQRTFFFEGSANDTATGRNVLIVDSKGGVESLTTAKSGHIEAEGAGHFVVLDKGQRNEQNTQSGEKTLSRFDTYRSQVGDRATAAAVGPAPRARSTGELWREPTPANLGELVWRVGLVFAGANVMLLGIGMSASYRAGVPGHARSRRQARHEDSPPALLRRHHFSSRFRRCRLSRSLLLHRFRRRAGRHRRARLHGAARRCLFGPAGARPLLRADADCRPHRHHLRPGAAGAIVAIHDPAHRRSRTRPRALAAGEPVARLRPGHVSLRRLPRTEQRAPREPAARQLQRQPQARPGRRLDQGARQDARGRAQLLDQCRLGRSRIDAARCPHLRVRCGRPPFVAHRCGRCATKARRRLDAARLA